MPHKGYDQCFLLAAGTLAVQQAHHHKGQCSSSNSSAKAMCSTSSAFIEQLSYLSSGAVLAVLFACRNLTVTPYLPELINNQANLPEHRCLVATAKFCPSRRTVDDRFATPGSLIPSIMATWN